MHALVRVSTMRGALPRVRLCLLVSFMYRKVQPARVGACCTLQTACRPPRVRAVQDSEACQHSTPARLPPTSRFSSIIAARSAFSAACSSFSSKCSSCAGWWAGWGEGPGRMPFGGTSPLMSPAPARPMQQGGGTPLLHVWEPCRPPTGPCDPSHTRAYLHTPPHPHPPPIHTHPPPSHPTHPHAARLQQPTVRSLFFLHASSAACLLRRSAREASS